VISVHLYEAWSILDQSCRDPVRRLPQDCRIARAGQIHGRGWPSTHKICWSLATSAQQSL